MNQTPPIYIQYVESNAGTKQDIYYNTKVAENDSRFMRGSKDQGSKLSISEVLARIELFYILLYIVGAQSKVCAYWANLRATRLA